MSRYTRCAAGFFIVFSAIATAAMSAFAGADTSSAQSAATADATFTADFENPARTACVHHEIDVDLDPQTAVLKGSDRFILIHPAGVPGDLPAPFLLNRNLAIETMTAEPSGDLSWIERERWEPRDFWERPEYPDLDGLDHARQVDLYWSAPGGKKHARASWPETLAVSVRYEGVVYDSLRSGAAYQRGFETTTGLIDPRGAFMSGTTLWHPYRPGERFTFAVRARVPEGWETVSQGARMDPLMEAGTRLTGWRCVQPMEEIYLIAGPYVLREDDHDGIRVQAFTYGKDDDSLATAYIDATGDYLDLYGNLIGRYPFEKFALVENFWQTGYGMPSFTLLGDRVIRLPFIIHTSYGHEILHNWWGNGVFVDPTHGNWCEGLTAYGADYLYKERESADAARDYRRTVLQDYRDYVRTGRDFALTEFRSRDDASSQSIGYGKSMMLFHMLRSRLGDQSFWNALGSFYAGYLFQSASWQDLLTAFGAQPGGDSLDVKRFHDEWIARPGAPMLKLVSADLQPAETRGVDLRIRLSQEPPVYTLDVPVRATLADGRAISFKVPMNAAETEARLRLPEAPRSLAVDPDFDLFRRLHPQEIPVALSGVMGADSLIAVLPGNADAASRKAYEELMREWRPDSSYTVIEEAGSSPQRMAGKGAWLFAEPVWWPSMAASLPPELKIDADSFTLSGTKYDRRKYTLAAALPNPAGDEESMAILIAPSPEAASAAGRKLTHYGKYGYLVFEGANNIAKGSWTPGRSPLTVTWSD